MAGLEFESLYAESCPVCFSQSVDDFLRSGYLGTLSVLTTVVNDIKSGNLESANEKLFTLYNENLKKGVEQVYKPNSEYFYKFEANATKFAAYKSAYVTNTLQKALTDRPQEFDVNAKRIIKTFNRFQVTEYNTMVARCRSAKQFSNFLKNTGLYPNLEWLRSRSASPRELHLSYVGLILPIGHSFWKSNQPGNLYGCKCGWRQTSAGTTTEIPEANIVKPAVGLEGNPAFDRRIFTEKHPYFKRFTESDKAKVDDFITNKLLQSFEQRQGYAIHPSHDPKSNDLKDLIQISRHFSKSGQKAFIMPRISHYENDFYSYLFAGSFTNKCPDLRINGKFFEWESFTALSNNTLSNMVGRATKQAENIIIDLRNTNITVRELSRTINGRIQQGVRIESVYAYTDTGIVRVY